MVLEVRGLESMQVSRKEGQRESQADSMLSTEPYAGLDFTILRS